MFYMSFKVSDLQEGEYGICNSGVPGSILRKGEFLSDNFSLDIESCAHLSYTADSDIIWDK
jgi:hypothetical protein